LAARICYNIFSNEGIDMSTKDRILKTIQDNNDRIKSYGVKRVGIFGSFARSSQNKKSDIDVLIEFEKGKKAFDSYMELKFFLEELFNRKIDLVIREALKPAIRDRVLDEVCYARL
jgi:hypothetical protein